jgi:hypothetical protein
MGDTAEQKPPEYPPGTDEEQALFEQVLEAMLADFGQHDKATKDQVNTGMRGIWAKPLVAKLQTFVAMDSSEEVDVTVARRILFMPRASDARVYARIFAAPEEGKEGANIVRHASSLLYMRHSQDELFLEYFVNAGGIAALARVFEHVNPYLRSQGVDTVKRIVKLTTESSAGEVVWAQSERSPRVQHMFARMFDALCGEHFLPGLVANLEKGETWPGGLGSCLELFAFALSWLQNFFVADQDLRIPATIAQLFELMEEELPEEHPSVALVVKLKEDFPPLPAGDERNRDSVHLAFWRQCRPPAEAAPPSGPEAPGTRLPLFRALGNEAFKKQRWGRAELCYGAAEREGGPGLELVLSNRAAARLKLQNFAGARDDAAGAVALDAKNAKAWFRLAEARVGLADVAAREAAEMAHSLAPSSATEALVKKAEAIVASPADKENAAPAWAKAEVTSGEEIRVVVSFVEALKASDVDVDIADLSVRLRGPAEEVLEIPLPVAVDDKNAVAKFSSKKQQLTLILPLA